jgi:hypothetical protein
VKIGRSAVQVVALLGIGSLTYQAYTLCVVLGKLENRSLRGPSCDCHSAGLTAPIATGSADSVPRGPEFLRVVFWKPRKPITPSEVLNLDALKERDEKSRV